jgi:2'-5' RNA ligase
VPRLFVAVDLPAEVRESVASLAGGLPGARWVPSAQLHLTLAFIGEVDGALAADAREALRSVDAPAFELSLRGVGHFPPRGAPRVAWAGLRPSEPLAHLQRAVTRALERAGCRLEARKFHAHVTIARLDDPPPRRMAEWLAAGSMFETGPFVVDEFLLYSSRLGSSGATHSVEEAYPLGGPTAA